MTTTNHRPSASPLSTNHRPPTQLGPVGRRRLAEVLSNGQATADLLMRMHDALQSGATDAALTDLNATLEPVYALDQAFTKAASAHHALMAVLASATQQALSLDEHTAFDAARLQSWHERVTALGATALDLAEALETYLNQLAPQQEA